MCAWQSNWFFQTSSSHLHLFSKIIDRHLHQLELSVHLLYCLFFDGAVLFVEDGFCFVDAAVFFDAALFGSNGVIVDGTRFLSDDCFLLATADASSAGEGTLRLRPADGWKLELTKRVTCWVAPLMAFPSPPGATDLRRGEAIASRWIQPATMLNPCLGASLFGGMSIDFVGRSSLRIRSRQKQNGMRIGRAPKNKLQK